MIRGKTNQYVKSQYQISFKNGNVAHIHDKTLNASNFDPRCLFFLR